MTRLLGAIFLLLGALAAARDLLLGEGRLRALGEWWFALHPESLQLAQPAIERHLAPWLWDPPALFVLEQPAALLFAVVGAALLLLSLRRRR